MLAFKKQICEFQLFVFYQQTINNSFLTQDTFWNIDGAVIMLNYFPGTFVNLNMERLTINIPESKSSLVKQILKELGVVIRPEKQTNISDFRKKLANVSVWSDDDQNYTINFD